MSRSRLHCAHVLDSWQFNHLPMELASNNNPQSKYHAQSSNQLNPAAASAWSYQYLQMQVVLGDWDWLGSLILAFTKIPLHVRYLPDRLSQFMSKPRLGYWRSRGLAQVPRLLLAYTGTDFEDVRYKQPEEWFGKDREGLGLEFPNLPYFIDGDLKLTESAAISVYIIERSKKSEQLLGKSLKERARVINVTEVIRDIYEHTNRLIYDPEFSKKRDQVFKESISERLKRLQALRGNKDWLLDRLTLADFALAELSYYIESVFPNEYKNLNFLHEVRTRFLSLPEIKSYYERQDAVKGPFTWIEKAVIKF